MENIYIAIATGALALLFALALARLVLKEDQGTDTMKEIGKAIQEGASAFLGREYRTLAIFVVIVAVVLGLFIDPETAVALRCWRHLLRRHRVHRHEHSSPGQYAHCQRRYERPQPRTPCGLQQRRGDGDYGGRDKHHWPLHSVPDLPGHHGG